VDVFRPSEEAGGIVDSAIERAERVGDVSAVWLQLEITDAAAGERAADAGIDFVQDECLKVEHRRLVE
jgi:Predicted CoA-binding protein